MASRSVAGYLACQMSGPVAGVQVPWRGWTGHQELFPLTWAAKTAPGRSLKEKKKSPIFTWRTQFTSKFTHQLLQWLTHDHAAKWTAVRESGGVYLYSTVVTWSGSNIYISDSPSFLLQTILLILVRPALLSLSLRAHAGPNQTQLRKYFTTTAMLVSADYSGSRLQH